jgi:hypothetical protein
LTALAAGACLAASRSSAAADEDRPGSDERPQKADVLVLSEGEHAGQTIAAQDLKRGDHMGELQAWDPATGKKVWSHHFPKSQLFGSVTATAGDLLGRRYQ